MRPETIEDMPFTGLLTLAVGAGAYRAVVPTASALATLGAGVVVFVGVTAAYTAYMTYATIKELEEMVEFPPEKARQSRVNACTSTRTLLHYQV